MQGLIALGKGLIEPPLQLSVGTPQIGYFVIERRGHMLTPTTTGTYFDQHPPPVGKGVPLDHLLDENVKSASGFSGLLTGLKLNPFHGVRESARDSEGVPGGNRPENGRGCPGGDRRQAMEGLLRGERGHATAARLIGLRATPRRVVWPTERPHAVSAVTSGGVAAVFLRAVSPQRNLTDHRRPVALFDALSEKPDRRGPLRRWQLAEYAALFRSTFGA